MLLSGRGRQGRLMTHVTARERNNGCCTQQGNDQSVCHTTWRPARGDTVYITNFSWKRVRTYQHLDDPAIAK
jgi:hypothetical protein